MAKSREEKKLLIESYQKLLEKSACVIVVKPNGLTPNETNAFRKEILDINSKFHVVKNTLFAIALKNSGLPEISELSDGSHAVLFCEDDYVTASKKLKNFIETAVNPEDKPKIEIVKAILEGDLLEKDQVAQLADMPTKEGSVALILGILDQAIAGVANVLEDSVKSYLSILDQAYTE